MGAAERHETNQEARAKNRVRVAQRQENRAIDAELRRVPKSNAPPLTREGAASAVEKAATAKQNKAKERRSAQYAVCQQRKDSRLTKHSPSEED